MNNRISVVEHYKSISVDESSVVEIGDSLEVTPHANVLAVQREKTIFFENEFQFDEFRMFGSAMPLPVVDEGILINRINQSPCIRVEKLEVPFVAVASVIHIGSTDRIFAHSRVKDIRHFFRSRPAQL